MTTAHRSLAFVALVALAACSSGNAITTPTIAVPASPTPAPAPSVAPAAPFSAGDTVAVDATPPDPTTGAVSVPVASDTSGAGATVELDSTGVADIGTGATIDSSLVSTIDPTLPPLSLERSPLSRQPDAETKLAALGFLRIRLNVDVTFRKAPGFTLTIPGTLSPTNVYELAFYDPLRPSLGFQRGFEGPATLASATVNGKAVTRLSFPSNNAPLTLISHQSYYFGAYARSATSTKPTPAPTNVATAVPVKPAPVVASPAALIFAGPTASPQSVTVAQTGATKALTAKPSASCGGVATVSGAGPAFQITPSGTGACYVVFVGDRGASKAVPIVVQVAQAQVALAASTSNFSLNDGFGTITGNVNVTGATTLGVRTSTIAALAGLPELKGAKSYTQIVTSAPVTSGTLRLTTTKIPSGKAVIRFFDGTAWNANGITGSATTSGSTTTTTFVAYPSYTTKPNTVYGYAILPQ